MLIKYIVFTKMAHKLCEPDSTNLFPMLGLVDESSSVNTELKSVKQDSMMQTFGSSVSVDCSVKF